MADIAKKQNNAKKPVGITETILRDAHQSLIATRMTTEEMLPILDKLDKIGYYSLECWGGATYDACLRFLNEDPWARLRTIREHCPNTKLQMLFRGQNMLGYRHYADDCVEYLVQRSVANGIDIIRIFDCLNDLRNLKTAVKAANKEKAHAQVALSYTLGDAYTLEYWVGKAKEIEEMTGRTYSRIHIVGGGSNAGYLNELTAKATKKEIHAGPGEATAIGNITAQMLKAEEFKTIEEARTTIHESFGIKVYKA